MVAVIRRRPIPALAAVVVAVTVLVLPGAARADEISDKKAQAQAIAAKIAQLSNQVEQYAEAANGAQYELDRLSTEISSAEGRVAAAEAEVALRREQLKGYAIDAYVHGDRAAQAEAVLDNATNDNSFAQRKGYLSAAADSRQTLIDGLRSTQQDLNEQIGQLNDAKSQAEAKSTELKEARARAEGAVAEHQRLKSQTDSEIAALVAAAEAAEAAAQAQRAQQRAQQEQSRQATPPGGGGGGGGGGSPAPAPAPKPTPTPAPTPSPGPAPAPSDGAAAAVAEGMRQIGKPYQWGGSGPDSFDCSGFTAWAWRAGGVSLPHFTDAQYAQTTHISLSQLQPGDLVYHNGSGGSWQHVGLYIGNGQMVHAPGSGRYVRVDSIYYWDTSMAASRP